ncbi:MAG: PfkB family carbohydrate kinase [Gammaproteobacteria bacterium]|nr:PfkB family carbohydrate kinase [Gammaproteobacteria bacterium]
MRRPWLSCVVLRVLLNEHQVYSTGAGAIPDLISDSPRIVLTGTLAIDYVAAYPGVFSELPRHPGINLAVQLESIERRFGGCAMNIAYTLRLLGNDPVPFVYVGKDFDNEYAAHLRACGVDMSGIHLVDAPHSAHAFIFTDNDQNQFTGFFGGPGPTVEFGPELRRHSSGFEFGVLAPDLPANMITAARALREGGVPFLTDPGQNLTDFCADEATELIAQSTAVIVNEFEYLRLRDLVADGLNALDLVVVTEGERGVRWYSKAEGDGRERAVAARIVDPTGCGDGFRGGFVHARLRGSPISEAVRTGAVTAAMVLETAGTQSHRCEDFGARYRRSWGHLPEWSG